MSDARDLACGSDARRRDPLGDGISHASHENPITNEAVAALLPGAALLWLLRMARLVALCWTVQTAKSCMGIWMLHVKWSAALRHVGKLRRMRVSVQIDGPLAASGPQHVGLSLGMEVGGGLMPPCCSHAPMGHGSMHGSVFVHGACADGSVYTQGTLLPGTLSDHLACRRKHDAPGPSGTCAMPLALV